MLILGSPEISRRPTGRAQVECPPLNSATSSDNPYTVAVFVLLVEGRVGSYLLPSQLVCLSAEYCPEIPPELRLFRVTFTALNCRTNLHYMHLLASSTRLQQVQRPCNLHGGSVFMTTRMDALLSAWNIGALAAKQALAAALVFATFPVAKH